MEIALEKKAHVFRLPTYLLDKLKELTAKDCRSLNNDVEGLLLMPSIMSLIRSHGRCQSRKDREPY